MQSLNFLKLEKIRVTRRRNRPLAALRQVTCRSDNIKLTLYSQLELRTRRAREHREANGGQTGPLALELLVPTQVRNDALSTGRTAGVTGRNPTSAVRRRRKRATG